MSATIKGRQPRHPVLRLAQKLGQNALFKEIVESINREFEKQTAMNFDNANAEGAINAIEAAGTGYIIRTGTGTFRAGTITGTTNQVNVASGTGVSSNTVLSLPQDIATTSQPSFAGLYVTGIAAYNQIYASATSKITGIQLDNGQFVIGKTGGAPAAGTITAGNGITVTPGANSVTVANANALLDGAAHTDTVAQTVSRGSLIYGNSTPKWDELVIGAANTVLKSDGTDASWGTVGIAAGGTGQTTATAAFNALDPLTTQGDTLYHNGTDSVRLAAGTAGQVLLTNGSGANPAWSNNIMTATLGPFYINDLPGTATTAATLGFFNTATATSRGAFEIQVAANCHITGLYMVSDAARTGGTATARVRIAGSGATFNSGAVVLDATNTTSDASHVLPSAGNAVTAGQTIGCDVVTSSWTPTTANIALWVTIVYD